MLTLPLLAIGFGRVRRAYAQIGERLELGRIQTQPPHRSLVVVPVSGLSRLTCQALTAARSLGDEVLAVTVTHCAPEDRQAAEALRRDSELWKPGVELTELTSQSRSLGRPVSAYVRELARTHPDAQVAVLIPETEPAHLWQRMLQNQRGSVVAHAVRRDTEAVI